MPDNYQPPTPTGNPTLDKFLSTFDTPEKLTAHADAARALYERFNAGAPIAPVRPSDLRQFWDVSRRINADMLPKPGGAIGLTVYAGYGFEAASAGPEQWVPITVRCQLLSALIERGVLKDYLHEEELDERVIRAAATMPCDKNDLGEAMMPQALANLPTETVAKAKEEMLANGYDPDKPNVDGKFLDWLREHC